MSRIFTVSCVELRICCICVDGRWGRNKNLVPCIGLPSLWTSSCKLVMVSSTLSSFEDRKYFHVSLFFPVLPAPHCLLHVRCSFSSNNSQGKIPHRYHERIRHFWWLWRNWILVLHWFRLVQPRINAQHLGFAQSLQVLPSRWFSSGDGLTVRLCSFLTLFDSIKIFLRLRGSLINVQWLYITGTRLHHHHQIIYVTGHAIFCTELCNLVIFQWNSMLKNLHPTQKVKTFWEGVTRSCY